MDTPDIITGVDDNSFSGFCVAHQGAVALQGTNRKRLLNKTGAHGSSVKELVVLSPAAWSQRWRLFRFESARVVELGVDTF
jgi:hypothetical protein